MKKKLISALLCVSMVATLLVGCGSTETPADTTTDSTDASVEDTADTTEEAGSVYYLNFKPEVEEVWGEIAAAYTAETGIEVNVVTAASGTYEEVLKSEIASSTPVTLFQINGPIGYENWKDYCLDLSSTDFYNALSDKTLAVTGVDGGVYGVPYAIEGYGIIYNDAIMQAYFALDGALATSVDEINNFETLKAVVEDMQAKADTLGIDGVFASTSLLPGEDWRWQTHTANMPVFYEYQDAGVNDLTELAFTYEQEFRNIFDLYVNNSCTTPTLLGSKSVSDSMAEFALGQVAMVQNGNWGWSQIAGVDGNIVAEEDVKFMPIYTGAEGEENQGLCIGTENFFSINSQASEADQKASIDFVNWLISSDTGKDAMVNKLGNISPFSTFAEDERPTDPLAISIFESMESGKTAVSWTFTSFPGQDFKDDLGAAMLEYCNGNMEWADVADTFKTRWAEEKTLLAQ